MRSYIASVRRKVEPLFTNITAGRIGAAWQPLLIWKNTQYLTHRRKFDQDGVVEPEWDKPFGPGRTGLFFAGG